MSYDVVIIGGSFAGLSAALPLSRARRRVLLVDAGQPRNRFAAAAHNMLALDGMPPAEIVAQARRQLCAYPTLTMIDDLVSTVDGVIDGFTVTLRSGATYQARRLILATGVRDELPALPGLKERWGTSVLHCPYCHGYEVAGQPLGVLAAGPGSDMKGLLLSDWGPTTLFTEGTMVAEPAMAEKLAARGVTIEPVPIVELLGDAPAMSSVRLADGRVLPLAALFVGPRTHMATPLAMQLGCAFEEGHSGPHLQVDGWKETSVPGVYAAGDAMSAMHSGPLAMAAGALAGVGAHKSLIM